MSEMTDYEFELLKMREKATDLVEDLLKKFGLKAIEDSDYRRILRLTVQLVDDKITFEEFEHDLQEVLLNYKHIIRDPSKVTVEIARSLSDFLDKIRKRFFKKKKKEKE
ncbi:MAG: hypothetical protein Q6363_006880 [Candidatus Njordarchaeota archaeon]